MCSASQCQGSACGHRISDARFPCMQQCSMTHARAFVDDHNCRCGSRPANTQAECTCTCSQTAVSPWASQSPWSSCSFCTHPAMQQARIRLQRPLPRPLRLRKYPCISPIGACSVVFAFALQAQSLFPCHPQLHCCTIALRMIHTQAGKAAYASG